MAKRKKKPAHHYPRQRSRRTGERLGDQPLTQNQKLIIGTTTGATFLFFLVFIWQMQEVLTTHTDWAFVKNPPGVREILRAIFFATLAFGGALYSDFRKVIRLIRGNNDIFKER